jgi:beta-lactamase regulating signal transducer with metallopeptidase domain
MTFDFLMEMAWKSALISGGALAVATALRFRPAGERSAILRMSVAMILALPLIALLLPALPVVTETIRQAAPAAPTVLPAVDALPVAQAAAAASQPAGWDDPTPILEWLWLGGVAMVALRLLAGLATLGRWTRTASAPEGPEWTQALARARQATGLGKEVRLLVGDTPSPISWGWRRPVILLDRDTARDPGEADAVLAHEVAHIVRNDWAMLILARLAVASFWFNPLMWLLERRLIAEAEEAADARALASVDAESYAQTLLSCARQVQAPRLPATAIADKNLGRRVKAILGGHLRVGTPDPRRVRTAMALCALVAAPIAALKPVVATVYAQPAQPAPPAPAAISAAEPTAAPAAPAAPITFAGGPEAVAEAPAAPQASALPVAAPAPAAPLVLAAIAAAPAPLAPPAPPPPPPPPGDWAPVDSQAIADSVRTAVREAMGASRDAMREAARAREEVRRALTPERMAEIRRAAEEARVATRRGLAEGSRGMEEGARGMEQGARQMDEEAERLRSPQYRAEQIARAARDGRRVTDAELVAAIPRLHDGADKLRKGAVRMRESGDRMRRGG